MLSVESTFFSYLLKPCTQMIPNVLSNGAVATHRLKRRAFGGVSRHAIEEGRQALGRRHGGLDGLVYDLKPRSLDMFSWFMFERCVVPEIAHVGPFHGDLIRFVPNLHLLASARNVYTPILYEDNVCHGSWNAPRGHLLHDELIPWNAGHPLRQLFSPLIQPQFVWSHTLLVQGCPRKEFNGKHISCSGFEVTTVSCPSLTPGPWQNSFTMEWEQPMAHAISEETSGDGAMHLIPMSMGHGSLLTLPFTPNPTKMFNEWCINWSCFNS